VAISNFTKKLKQIKMQMKKLKSSFKLNKKEMQSNKNSLPTKTWVQASFLRLKAS